MSLLHHDAEKSDAYLKLQKPLQLNNFKTVSDLANYLGVEENILTESHGIFRPLHQFIGTFTSHVKEKGHDGVIVEHNKINTEIVVFGSEQIKSADPVSRDDNGEVIPLSERFNEEKDDIRFSLKDSGITYDSLVKKPDMKVTIVTTTMEDIIDCERKDIVNNAKDRLKNKVGLDSKNRTVVHNIDTDSDVVVGKPGIEHGLDRNYQDTAIVSMHLNEYLSNAIKINEVYPDMHRKYGGDILVGYGESLSGEKNLAYFVVSKLTTGKGELVEFGSLYSFRGKKLEDDSAQGSPGVQSRTSSKISISNLLDIVNEIYSDILPKSVLEHYGMERKNSKLGKSVKYSLSTDSTGKSLSKGQVEYFRDSKVRDENGNLKVVYHGTTEGFYTFDMERSGENYWYGESGFFFTDKKSSADNYATLAAGTQEKPRTISAYLNLKNPAIHEAPSLLTAADYFDMHRIDILQEADIAGNDGVIINHEYGNLYVAFEPSQIKSTDNLNPTEDEDIRYSLKDAGMTKYHNKALLTENRLNKYLDSYAASNPEYAQAYIAYVNPYDFIYLTTTIIGSDKIKAESTPLDESKLKDTGDIFLRIESAGEDGSYRVIGHEGRHRMNAMVNAGIREVPVLLIDSSTKYEKSPMDLMKLEPQKFGSELDRMGIRYIHRVDVLSSGNKSALIEKYTQEDLLAKYSDGESLRFSLNTSETEQAIKDVLQGKDKTIDMLEEKVGTLKKEFKRTKLKDIEPKNMRHKVLRYLKSIDSEPRQTPKVTEAVTDIFRIFKNPKGVDWDAAYSRAVDISKEIVDNVSVLHDDLYKEYADLRKYLRKAKIQLTDSEKANIVDYEAFRKANFGKVQLVNSGRPADTVYAELVEMYPEFFSEEVTDPADQVREMSRVVDSLKPYYETLNSSEAQDYVSDVAADIMNLANTAETKTTFADREKAKRDKLAERLKQERKDAVARIKMTEKEKRAQVVRTYKEKIQQTKQKQQAKTSRKAQMNSIKRNVDYLSQALLKPTDTKHIPKEYRTAIAQVLGSLDFETTRTDAWAKKYGEPSKHVKGLQYLSAQYRLITNTGENEHLNDPYIEMLIDSLAEKAEDKRLADLDNKTLADVAVLVRYIRHTVSRENRAFNDNVKEKISDMGEKTISSLEAVGKEKKNAGGIYRIYTKLVRESNVNPSDFFETLKGIGEPMYDMYMEVRRGFDKHETNIHEAQGELHRIIDKKKAAAWSEKADLHSFTLSNDQTVEMTPAQIMSLYCLMKREQAQSHILGSGIILDSVLHKDHNVIKRIMFGKKTRRQDGTLISYSDVENIIGTLTEEQKDVADKIMGIMNTTCKDWGNDASMKLYGYEKFNEANYFPIKSAQEWLDTNSEKFQQTAKIKNQGMTKAVVENANNPIVISDIFDVVTKHVNDMSMYNSLAVPLTDFERVYNYKGRSGGGYTGKSVKLALDKFAGNTSTRYIDKFLKDVNNSRAQDTEVVEKIQNKLLANYKKATIGFSGRVLIQQPTAAIRAMTVIDAKHILKGFAQKPSVAVIKEMQEHCPIARWKANGKFETDMSRSIRDELMGKRYLIDRLTMDPYGFADNLAWACIWKAVKNETEAKIRKGQLDVNVGSDEYWEACNERMRYVVDRTQVVDSVFHRSQVMRNQNIALKIVSAFMAEPTKTFNMLRTECILAGRDWQKGNKSQAAKRLTRVGTVFVINAAAVSAAAALYDLLRNTWDGDDDDDDEDAKKSRWEKYFDYATNNFWGNVNPLSGLVGPNIGVNALNGFETENLSTKAISDTLGLIDDWKKYMDGDSNLSLVGMIVKSATPIGQLTGMPLKNFEREFETVYRTYIGSTAGWDMAEYLVNKKFKLNIKSEKNESTFKDFYIAALKKNNYDEAELIRKDLKKNGFDDEALDKTLWKAFGEGLKEKVLAGEDYKKIVEKLKKVGIKKGDIKDKIDDYVKSNWYDAVKTYDVDKIKAAGDILKKNGYSKGDIKDKIKSSLYNDYKEAVEGNKKPRQKQIESVLRKYGYSNSDMKDWRGYMEKDNYRSRAYFAYASGDTAKAYKIAYQYCNKYPNAYKTGADGMILGFKSTEKSTIREWKEERKKKKK